jgi:hypothetical protein
MEATCRLLFVDEGVSTEDVNDYERRRKPVRKSHARDKYGVGSKLVRDIGESDGEGLGTKKHQRSSGSCWSYRSSET